MSKGGEASKFLGIVAVLGLAGMGLLFLFAVMDESRSVNNEMPAAVAIIGGVVFVALWRSPVGKGIAKLLEGHATQDDQLTLRVEQLEDRLAELGADPMRMAELEDRLDFAERLLAQRGEVPALRRPEELQ